MTDPRSLTSRRPSWLGMHVGDSRQMLADLPGDARIDLTVTSPPYFDAVDYGVAGQVGFGQDYGTYLQDMESVFERLYERTTATGSLWVIADTIRDRTRRQPARVVPLPFDLSSRAERAGWVLQDVVIWRKDRTLPWSRPGRLRNAFEYVLFFVKGSEFKFHLQEVRTTEGLESWWRRYPERYSPLGASPTNVWDFPIPLQGSWSSGVMRHQCPLPAQMVARIVRLCSDPADVVCDPFAGVGTVPAVAAALDRDYVAFEINEEYAHQFSFAVLPQVSDELNGPEGRRSSIDPGFGILIARLRHAKLPRVLARHLRASGVAFSAMTVEATPREPQQAGDFDVGSQTITLYVAPGEEDRVAGLAREALKRRPLSKYGVRANVIAVAEQDWVRPTDPAGWTRIRLDSPRPTPMATDVLPLTEQPLILINVPPGSLVPGTGAYSIRAARVTRSRCTSPPSSKRFSET